MLCKRRHAHTPIRFPGRPIFNTTLRAAASWPFFLRRGGSTRMNPDMGASSYMRDGTIGHEVSAPFFNVSLPDR
jgi:hypothetical protein